MYINILDWFIIDNMSVHSKLIYFQNIKAFNWHCFPMMLCDSCRHLRTRKPLERQSRTWWFRNTELLDIKHPPNNWQRWVHTFRLPRKKGTNRWRCQWRMTGRCYWLLWQRSFPGRVAWNTETPTLAPWEGYVFLTDVSTHQIVTGVATFSLLFSPRVRCFLCLWRCFCWRCQMSDRSLFWRFSVWQLRNTIRLMLLLRLYYISW